MAWYKTGKVTVQTGSTVVTGTTTKFASNVRVGDGFRGPDGEWYEVVNIASETVLGIFPAYEGPSASDASNYMIAPIQGYNKESADRLRAITDSIRDFGNEIETATEAARSASVSATQAKASQDAAKASENNVNSTVTIVNNAASQVAQDAAQVAQDKTDVTSMSNQVRQDTEDAANSAAAAKNSETAASDSANNASTSETNTAQKASEAQAAADSATASRNAASASEAASRASEQAAEASASTASDAATVTAQDRQATQQARTEAEAARDEAVAAAGTVTGGIIDRGGIDLSSGQYPNKPTTSSIWKVTVGGVVDGIDYGVGDNLAYSLALDEFYKIDSTDSVTSVNGKGGIVVLDKTDIGLGNVDDTSDADKPASNAVVTALATKVDKVVGKQLSDENFTLAEKNKLGSVADGATKNSTDATLLNRANHTGTQVAATISDLSAAVRLVTASGLTLSNAAILSTDTILVALGKAQGQINANIASIGTKASAGANNDITSLSGLTTPLSIAQGGNGGETTPYLPVADANIQMNNGMYSTQNTWTGSPFTGTDSRNYGYLHHFNWIDNNQQFQRWKSIYPTVKEMVRSKLDTVWGEWTEASSGGGGGLAVGTMFPWKFNRATIPGGSLPHDGQIVANGRTLYPEFWALIQPFCVTDAVWLASPFTSRGMFSLGDGSTSFRMPDDNGKHADGNTIAAMFLRGDGKNSAGTPGLHQADQFQGFRFGVASGGWTMSDNDGYAAANTTGSGVRGIFARQSGAIYTPITDGINGTPRVGSETRSPSSTVIWCTAVANTAVNSGTVDVTALSNTVTSQGASIADIQSKQVFTKFFQSANTAWTAGGLIEVTHNLGQPKMVQVFATLTVATPSSPVGTIIAVSSVWINTNYWGGMVVAETPTLVRVRLGTALGLLVSAGSAETLTPSNSQIFVRIAA